MLESRIIHLLDKFLSCFLTKKSDYIGHQASPSNSFIRLSIPSKPIMENYGTFILQIAPFDGYATISKGGASCH